MDKLILTPVDITDLVHMIANEVEARLTANRSESLNIKEENFRFMGDKALAIYLHCSVQTINKLKKAGKLPFHRYGRKYYYIQSEIDLAFNGKVK